MKKCCDNYFYNEHHHEPRGVAGIFMIGGILTNWVVDVLISNLRVMLAAVLK